ncbi:MAG: glycosyltransferase [Desulfobacteraceae bacterium]|nr:MAG: glycosyltransferase [Desulfobacteraceae bacterium]
MAEKEPKDAAPVFEPSGEKELAVLENFFSLVDTGKLFKSDDPVYYKKLRDSLQDALFRLLVEKRPYLEAEKELRWPYESLWKRMHLLNEAAQLSSSPFVREQACLFLCRLPFPGQWQYLFQAEKTLAHLHELQMMLVSEKAKIRKKIEGKAQKSFKLRHLFQVLKKPRLPHEKGVLRIFSLPYLFIDRALLKELTRSYVLHVEPAAGVMYRHSWLRAFSGFSDPSVFGAAGEEDRRFLDTQAGIVTTELAHSDYLEDDISLYSRPEKKFDIVFNGTYDEMHRKRHLKMLELLRHPKLKTAKVLFLGRGKRENVEEFIGRVSRCGVSDRVTVLSNLSRREVPGYLAGCRMAVHLALHENGCRCIHEYFRSDLPCVVSSYSAGINFDIINPQTGAAAPEQDLADAICRVLQDRDRFSPRSWFLSHSGSANASERLNAGLKALFTALGYEWTEDIVPLGSSGASRYVQAAHCERFRPQFEAIYETLTRKVRIPVKLELD